MGEASAVSAQHLHSFKQDRNIGATQVPGKYLDQPAALDSSTEDAAEKLMKERASSGSCRGAKFSRTAPGGRVQVHIASYSYPFFQEDPSDPESSFSFTFGKVVNVALRCPTAYHGSACTIL